MSRGRQNEVKRKDAYLVQETPRTNRATFAYPHTRKDRDTGADPAVFLNDNIPAQRRTFAAHPPPRVDGIGGTHELDVRTQDAPRPNRHRTGIRDAAIGPDEDVIPNRDVVPVVAVEGGFDDDAFTAAAQGEGVVQDGCRFAVGQRRLRVRSQIEDFAEEAGALLLAGTVGRVRRVVEPPDGLDAFLAILVESGRHREVIHALQHFLAFGVLIGATTIGRPQGCWMGQCCLSGRLSVLAGRRAIVVRCRAGLGVRRLGGSGSIGGRWGLHGTGLLTICTSNLVNRATMVVTLIFGGCRWVTWIGSATGRFWPRRLLSFGGRAAPAVNPIKFTGRLTSGVVVAAGWMRRTRVLLLITAHWRVRRSRRRLLHWEAAILGLQRNRLLCVDGLLPSIAHCVAFTDEATPETVVTWHILGQ